MTQAISNLYGIIMAGGRGTRFWPASTSKKPKQYLALTDKSPLLYKTLERLNDLISIEKRFVVTVKEQEALAKEAANHVLIPTREAFILEPLARNTAPCILLTLAHLLKIGADGDAVVAILPSDHIILNEKAYRETMSKAHQMASQTDNIITIGIPATFPHTGFGYIQKGEEVENGFKVNAFKEKPSKKTATEYIQSGEFFWNAGMFVSRINTLLREFELHAPDYYNSLDDLINSLHDPEQLKEIYSQLRADSIDYAVMEKSSKISVTPATFDWNDLGSWSALENVCEKNQGNVVNTADQNNFLEHASGNIIYAPNQKVVLHDVNDHVIVSTDKILMILPKEDDQAVKEIMGQLKMEPTFKELL